MKNIVGFSSLNGLVVKFSLIFLMFLILVSQGSNINQSAILTLFSLFGIIYSNGFFHKKLGGIFLVLISLSFISLFHAFIFREIGVNYYYLIGEYKFFLIFILANFFYFLMKKNFLGKEELLDDVLFCFFKYYSLLLLFLGIYAFSKGYIRDSVLFGHSINVAYGLVYLAVFLGNKLNFKWWLIGLFVTLLMGSTTATLLYILSLVLNVNGFYFKRIFVFIPLIPIFFIYALEFRGKDFLGGNIEDFDRYQILSYYFQIIRQEFGLLDYMWGYGVGRALPNIGFTGLGVVDGWFLVSFAKDGVYSYASHNEFLRFFLNFGLVGVICLYVAILKILPKSVLFFMILAGLTNTTFYSTNNIFIISLLISVFLIKKKID
ncbi:hypothetical protein ACX2CK_10250 [Acinetobacter schindleri]